MEDAQKKLMMDQIKPHFLYNSLNSIIYYIDKNPEVAKDSLVSFSKYLRTNLNMVSLDEMIPFSQEMEHTKVYLSLEKLRFEDKLTVDFYIKDEE
jgi:LytS/YehU family sensor histidine kinase